MDASPPTGPAAARLCAWQRWAAAALAAGSLALLAASPAIGAAALIAASLAAFAVAFGFRAGLVLLPPLRPRERPAVAPESLPPYTVLCPLRGEERVAEALLEALDALDYPRDRLEVLLLLEEDDAPTAAAVERALDRRGRPAHVRVERVPDRGPATKPRACRHGLSLARGRLLTIFDAEDAPDPDQLRRAAAAFAAAGPGLACVQARLAIRNARQSPVTRLFAAEYDAWFTRVLPRLAAAGGPVPLGGTSNHFRVEVLRAAGGWDAYNVAEDADLGVRLARAGLRVGMLPATTWEEAPARPGAWMRQRSRWTKGFLQTALVALRRPGRLARELGPGRCARLALVLAGTPLIQLGVPALWALGLAWVLAPAPAGPLGPALAASAALLAAANLAYATMLAVAAGGRPGRALLLAPAYWLMEGLAAWRGLAQLVTRPHHWEKTEHGLAAAPERAARPLGEG